MKSTWRVGEADPAPARRPATHSRLIAEEPLDLGRQFVAARQLFVLGFTGLDGPDHLDDVGPLGEPFFDPGDVGLRLLVERVEVDGHPAEVAQLGEERADGGG